MEYNTSDWIAKWIAPKARILDLGCGDGTLLANLQKSHDIQGYGIEKNTEMILLCINKGVNILQLDLDKGLANFKNKSFDLVILQNTLQALQRPDKVIDEMLRVADKGIVTFHNFSHWYNRWYLSAKGKMPVSVTIPYSWYSTPNVHHCTCRDFELLCKQKDIYIEKSLLRNSTNKIIQPRHPLRNLIANEVTYVIGKK